MKKLPALLLSAALLFSACGRTETIVSGPETETSAPAVPADWGEEAARLLSSPWTVADSDAVGALTFDGERATWEIASEDGTTVVSGVPVLDGSSMTVEGTEFRWEILAAFCRLTADGTAWRLVRAESVSAARQPFRLVSGQWEGEGITLSFAGKTASLSVGDRTITGTYSLSPDGSLVLSNDGMGEASGNLALGAKVTASSMETPDFPPELAVDGNPGTRFSSAYEDPSWLTVDFGQTRTVGGAILTFEYAHSSEFKFEVSTDGNQWTEAAHVRGNSLYGADAPVVVPFDAPREARYVRFTGIRRGTEYGHSIYELELYEFLPGEAKLHVDYGDDEISVTMDGETYRLVRK